MFAAKQMIQALRVAARVNDSIREFALAAAALAPRLVRASVIKGTQDFQHSQFELKSYSGTEGEMVYWLYVPSGNHHALPALIMLHGCMQSPRSFARGTRMNRLADDAGVIVAYLSQPMTSNLHRCWNWFRTGNQQRDCGDAALIAAVTRAIVAENGGDAERVYIAGFSAGGATAAIMGATYPDLYAAIGIHSGLDIGAATSNWEALSAMRHGAALTAPSLAAPFIPMITFHGDCDRTINAINSAQIAEAASLRSKEDLIVWTETGFSRGYRPFSRKLSYADGPNPVIEQWTVHGAGHAWSGGRGIGGFTDPLGPDASRAMLDFFLLHRLQQKPVCAAALA